MHLMAGYFNLEAFVMIDHFYENTIATRACHSGRKKGHGRPAVRNQQHKITVHHLRP